MRGLHLRVFGIDISLGVGLFVLVAALGFLSRRSGVYLFEWIVVAMAAVVLHELGHAVALRRFGVPSRITFWGLGGATVPQPAEAARLSQWQWLVVSAAGPLVGVVIGGAVFALRPLLDDADRLVRVTAGDVIFANLGWAIFNMLPITSLDGGHVIQAFVGSLFGRRAVVAGTLVCVVASAGIAGLALQAGEVFVFAIALLFGVVAPLASLASGQPVGLGVRQASSGDPTRSIDPADAPSQDVAQPLSRPPNRW